MTERPIPALPFFLLRALFARAVIQSIECDNLHRPVWTGPPRIQKGLGDVRCCRVTGHPEIGGPRPTSRYASGLLLRQRPAICRE